ncbi:histidine kinase [Patiriisocius marinus]|uniref:histidine kinase n=2 Tax=Patiriisocius marinus TaxID=1397112 RepID=A0A5J4IYF8_9FLAO|nr:response regulator [Patiriisocius marinus]GER59966.1 histidine kinase [Patiriisocius marinus]
MQIVQTEFFKNNYDKTIQEGELAIRLSDSSGYLKQYKFISSYLGSSYLEIDDSIRAKKIFNNSIEYALKRNDTAWRLAAEIDLANYHALKSDTTSQRKAIKLYEDILPIAEILNTKNKLLVLNSNIAEMYLKLNEPDNAEKFIIESAKYFNEETFIGFKGSYSLNKGNYEFQKGNNEESIKNLNESIRIFSNLNHLDGKIQSYKTLVKIYAKQGKYKAAFKNQQILDDLEKEKFEVDKIEAVQTVSTRFKVVEMQKKIEEANLLTEIKEKQAKQETTFFWIKIASGILLIFSTILFFSYLNRKKLVVSLRAKNKQYLEEKERSEELMKAKSILYSNITHELRTPMYGIIGISNMLSENKLFKSEREHLKSLKFSADYLLSLVNNILHFNKLESDEPDDIKISNFDIRNLVYNTVESSKFLSEDHPNKYIVTIDHSIPNIISGDEMKISQILINLLGNASKFTNDGVIEINLEEIASTKNNIEIAFTIKDTGIGIDEKTLKTIYNKYAQTGTGQNFMGTGLGLPIVKKLIEQQGGQLALNSELRKGTIVTFSLNYGIAETKVLDEISPEGIKTILSELNILIVDDNKINQLITRKFVERHGAKGNTVGSGQEAIELAKNNKYDVILMDINMPEMNGFEATEIIRSFDNEIPIIALTAVDKEKVVGAHSFNLMNGIIIKPYSNEQFLNTLLANITISRAS